MNKTIRQQFETWFKRRYWSIGGIGTVNSDLLTWDISRKEYINTECQNMFDAFKRGRKSK